MDLFVELPGELLPVDNKMLDEMLTDQQDEMPDDELLDDEMLPVDEMLTVWQDELLDELLNELLDDEILEEMLDNFARTIGLPDQSRDEKYFLLIVMRYVLVTGYYVHLFGLHDFVK